jgi:hypothetical protein
VREDWLGRPRNRCRGLAARGGDVWRAEARRIRIEAAASGLRKPVNVLDGNYNLMPGVCPWWNGVRSEAAE